MSHHSQCSCFFLSSSQLIDEGDDSFLDFISVLRQLNGRLTIQAFKDRVMKVLRIWEDWAIYPPLFTKGLEASFLKDDKLLQSVFAGMLADLFLPHQQERAVSMFYNGTTRSCSYCCCRFSMFHFCPIQC